MIMIPITIVFLICVFFEKSDYQRSKECLPSFTKKEAEEYYNQTYNQKQHIIDIMKADEDDGLYKIFDTDSDKKH